MTSIADIEKICADNIKRTRKNKQITQAYLAEKIDISEKFISDIETGRSHCSLSTLVSIANVLDIEPYELLLPANKQVNYDSRRAKLVMKQLKSSFSDMVDTLGAFLEEE